MKTRIGYFVPEFPNQSQTWAWKEFNTLQDLGVEADLVSTRLPPQDIISHTWADEGQAITDYLIPFRQRDILLALKEIVLAGPIAWLKCLGIVLNAEDMTLAQRLRLLPLILVSGKLAWLARMRQWTHIHSLYCSNSAHLAMFASILRNCTYSLTLLGQLHNFGPNQRQKWKFATFALVMSRQLLTAVQKDLGDCIPDQIRIAPMGADMEKNKRHTPYKPWDGNGTCRIYACGRLNVAKGYVYLLKAIYLLRQQGLPVQLRIAGEDEKGGTGYRKEIESLIQFLNLSDCVELLGAVSEEQNRREYAQAHIFALGSLEEGISVAAMEAMCMELPVVVTKVGGMAELVDHYVNGLLVPSEDEIALTEAISKIMHNPALAIKLSHAARKKVATKFYHRRSAEVLAQELQKLQLA